MASTETKVCPRCGGQYDRLAIYCQKDGVRLVEQALESDPYIGRVLLDQFRIEELVGAGGMGTVYRAHQMNIGRDVAIKILHPELAQNPDAVRRFQREAKVTSALDHPNVVRVFLFGQLPDGSLYLVMQYLVGCSLMGLLATEPELSATRALHIASQVCDGVGEAHLHGIVHRDIKPENVFLVRRGNDPDFVKVLDFGIARFTGADQSVATQTGLIFGTARYISPEGASGERCDARSDVYSIGVLAYQLLVGRTPFNAPSPVALLMKHIHDLPPPIRTVPRGEAVSARVADVVMLALSKDPKHRYADADELGAALREAAALDGIPIGASRGPVHRLVMPAPTPMPGARGRASVRSGLRAESTPRVPFESEPVHVPGLRRSSPAVRNAFTLIVAFTLGAAAVVSGVWLARSLVHHDARMVDSARPPTAEPTRLEPVEEPEITAPDNPGTLTVDPAAPIAGRLTRLRAAFEQPLGNGERPYFRIEHEGEPTRRLVASPDEGRQAWQASHAFGPSADYRVAFVSEGEQIELTAEVTVGRAPRARRREPPVTTQSAIPSSPVVVPAVDPGDGIDWRVPATDPFVPPFVQPPSPATSMEPSPHPNPDPATEPPPPWTSENAR